MPGIAFSPGQSESPSMTVFSMVDDREIREWLMKFAEENRISCKEAVIPTVRVKQPLVCTSVPIPLKAHHSYTALKVLDRFAFGEDQHLGTLNSATHFEDGSQAGDSLGFVVFLKDRHPLWLEEISISMDIRLLYPLGSLGRSGSPELHPDDCREAFIQQALEISKQRSLPVFAYHPSAVVPLGRNRDKKKVPEYEFMGHYVITALRHRSGNCDCVRRMLAHGDSQWKGKGNSQQAGDDSKCCILELEPLKKTLKADSGNRWNMIMAEKSWRPHVNKLEKQQPNESLKGKNPEQKTAGNMMPRSLSTSLAQGPSPSNSRQKNRSSHGPMGQYFYSSIE